MTDRAHWEVLQQTPNSRIVREGRFIVVEFANPHRVLSTSAITGGQNDAVRFLVNHQSCEGRAHLDRHEVVTSQGQEHYHRATSAELGLSPRETALMGTAANMNYAALVREAYSNISVTAVVTAGVEGNASCAGDPADWHEGEDGWARANPHDGTINTIVLVDCPLTPAAQTRAVLTMTEAKSAALHDLAVSSRYSQDLATGTGTDQFCLAAPIDESRKSREGAGPHCKLGELIGRSVRSATKEALRWQNGLEVSYTRGIFKALGRHGVTEALLAARLKELLSSADYELLENNSKSAYFEPQVSAAAYALAAVIDRARAGTISKDIAASAIRQQTALLASSLAAKPAEWRQFWEGLHPDPDNPAEAVAQAMALGWQAKWR